MSAEVLEQMYQRWKGEVNFLVVYIREAHPWPRGSRKKGKAVLPEPADLDERGKHGNLCVRDLGMTMPMVLDRMDNKVGETWAGHPDRLYVLDARGKVVWRAGPGPFGFDPNAARKAFLKLIGKWPKVI